MLARVLGIIRSHEDFRCAYDARLDQLLEESRILDRGPDGRLRTPLVPVDPREWRAAYERILERMETEGFVQRAVSVLQAAGLRAWRNGAGHIAIDPSSLEKT